MNESAKVSTERRVDVYRREYFDLGSQVLKDYAAFRRVTADTLPAHVEQNRDYYKTIRPYLNEVVKQKPVIQAAADVLKKLNPDILLLQEMRDYDACVRLGEAIQPGAYQVAICSAFKGARQQEAILAKIPAQAAQRASFRRVHK